MKTPAPADLHRWSEELARNPASLAFLPLARAYRRMGRRDLAMQLCLRGLEYHPTHVEAHALLALLYFEAGERAKAADEWATVLRLKPGNFEALRGMGFRHLEQGDLGKARQHLERAALIRPDDATVQEALRLIRQREAAPAHSGGAGGAGRARDTGTRPAASRLAKSSTGAGTRAGSATQPPTAGSSTPGGVPAGHPGAAAPPRGAVKAGAGSGAPVESRPARPQSVRPAAGGPAGPPATGAQPAGSPGMGTGGPRFVPGRPSGTRSRSEPRFRPAWLPDDQPSTPGPPRPAAPAPARHEPSTPTRAAAPPSGGPQPPPTRPARVVESPALPPDPTRLFETLTGSGPLLGVLLLDRRGLVLAGGLSGGVQADELGANLGGAIDEAIRTATHLELGAWWGLTLETGQAVLQVRPVDGDALVVVAAERSAPAGWVMRAADHAATIAGRFVEVFS